MGLLAKALVGVCWRWVHITSVALLVGGLAYARFVVVPAISGLAPESRAAVVNKLVSKYRPFLLLILVALLASGLFNIFTKAAFPPHYQIWFGIKMLLVMHIYATAMILAAPGAQSLTGPRWPRLMLSMVVSGFCIILISALLRWLSLAV
jgi:hypothetical protein